jgi:hypothetical protein
MAIKLAGAERKTRIGSLSDDQADIDSYLTRKATAQLREMFLTTVPWLASL